MVKTEIVTDAAQLAAIRAEWASLLERSARGEPSQSPLWQLAWWRVFGEDGGRALRALLCYEGTRLIGLCPLLERRYLHRPQIPFRRLELIASGEDPADEIVSEYLGLIAERGAEERVATVFVDALLGGALGEWDELSMPFMNGESVTPHLLSRALRNAGVDARVEVATMAPYIPLPRSWDDYLAALSSSQRYLIRRSMRDFDAWAKGGLALHRAKSLAELEQGRRTLIDLHSDRWSSAGEAGAFASARFRAFHDEIMPALLDRGALDLFWMTVRDEPVVAMYSFVWQGRVQFYQGGRRADVPKGIRPGLVGHAHAIRHAIERGHSEYDFLGGASRYKMDFALATRPIVYLRAARWSLVEAARRTAEFALDGARLLRDGVRRVLSHGA